VAAGAHAVALVGNLALTLWPGPGVSVLALTLVGLGYGVISGLTAAAVSVGTEWLALNLAVLVSLYVALLR